MKLGLIARADNSGLGNQTWEFYRNMSPHKTMVVDISKMNNNPTFPERYPDRSVFIRGIPTHNDINEFLNDLDVVFVAEAPYNYSLYALARERGIKTAVQYNYEFFDWFAYPHYPRPDMLIAPSKWNYDKVQSWCDANRVKHIYLHCPVARDRLPMREIKQARRFLHTAGRSAARDRNGTLSIIAATRYLKTPAEVIVHFQGEQGLSHQETRTVADYEKFALEYGDPYKLSIIKREFEDYTEPYKLGDVLVLPRRYGGNCLPMNEALSTGMPVIMPDITPNREFLPENWLVFAQPIDRFVPRTVVDIFGVDPEDLAAEIDYFYNMNESQMWFENTYAGELAQRISWQNMKPQYEAAFEDLCRR